MLTNRLKGTTELSVSNQNGHRHPRAQPAPASTATGATTSSLAPASTQKVLYVADQGFCCRAGGTRTPDLLTPSQAR